MRLLTTLSILTLLGAGCASATQAPSDSQPSADTAKAEVTNVEVTTGGSTSITTEDGAVIEVQIPEDAQASQETEIPVTEIVLGEKPDAKVDVELDNFSITPATITTAPGARVSLNFTKVTGFHTFVIDAIGLNFSASQGEALTFTAPSRPGQYPYYCDIGSHRDFGMQGTLIVQ